MKRNRKTAQITRLAGAAAIAAGALGAQAQSVDSLLDKLVDKGVLTTKEAQEMREQSDKDFTTSYAAKSGMPEWVTAFKINGDFRGRYEGFYAPDPAFADRSRLRYRARIGFTATMLENLEVGIRLGTGDLDGGVPVGGMDPISNNQSFQNNASKKGIFVDQAYMKWSPLNTPDFNGGLTFGKMQNPMLFTPMVFDNDYTPEGGAVQFGWNASDKHTVSLGSGYFVVDEFGTGSSAPNDAFMVNSQLTLNSVWSPKFSTMVTGGFLLLANPAELVNGAVPNINTGNTRSGTTGVLDYEYNPLVFGGSGTYTLASFPMYPGAFPITVAGEYMLNTAAPDNDTINGVYTSTGNYAYNAGITFGKASKKGTWELSYNYRHLGANSWYEEVTDSDFGSFLAVAQPSSGQGTGYRSGTNNKGHIVRLAYSPWDMLTLSATWFYVELANQKLVSGTRSWDSHMNRLQVDASLKF
jgi:hypothetical protein